MVLAKVENADGVLLALERGRQALAEAKDAFEMLRIKDQAEAAVAAARVLKMTDVEISARKLVELAKREILKNTPPKQGERNDLTDNNFVAAGNEVPSATLRSWRRTHENIDDETFEHLFEEAAKTQDISLVTRMGFNKFVKEQKQEEKREQREKIREQAITEYFNDVLPVYHCGVAELHEYVERGSVDAIITDPPYPKEYLPVWSELGEFAAYALRPGGSLIAMSGQLYLPEVINRLLETGLEWRWIACYDLPGQRQQQHQPNVISAWKPLLIFKKPGRVERGPSLDKVVVPPLQGDEKDTHIWGQNIGGLTAIMEEWTNPGWLICDPLCGAGSTLKAAKDLGRRFIGCDIDAGNVAITKGALG